MAIGQLDLAARPVVEPASDASRLRTAFWAFVVAHVIVWTLVPLVSCPNAALDSVEMVYWGREWQLGYSKHPPLVAWLSAAVVSFTGPSPWGLYLAAQLTVAVCFWCAWRLGNEVAGPRIALAGVAALEGSFFLTFESTVLNNNLGLYPFWALAILSFYWALKRQQLRYWLATGLWVGCGLLCKYSMAVLPLVFAAFLLANSAARRAWRTPGPYLAALTAAATFGPHLWWAYELGFPTLKWAASRTHGAATLVGQLVAPVAFAFSEMLSLVLVLLVALPIVGFRPRLRSLPPDRRWDRDFLLAMTLGPFASLVLLSLLANVQFRGMHGSHLWPFVGLVWLWTLNAQPTTAQLRNSLRVAGLVGAVICVAFVVRSTGSAYLIGKASRERFPGAQLASEVERIWRERYDCPLTVVGGDCWLAGNIAFYSGDRPRVHLQECSWIDREEFLRHGGVLVWNATEWGDETIPSYYADLSPICVLPAVSLPQQTGAKVPEARIGLAIIPPPAGGARGDLARDRRPAVARPRVAERLELPGVKLR